MTNLCDVVPFIGGMFLWISEEYSMTEYKWMKASGSVSVSGDLGLGSGFVYLIPCWVVMLSDRYMYKLNHGRIMDRVADFPLTNKFFFFSYYSCSHILWDFCILVWNWHLSLRVSDWTLNSLLSASGLIFWYFILGAHSNSLSHIIQLLNKFNRTVK